MGKIETFICRLPAETKEGHLLGFSVWSGEPYYIPESMAVHYALAEGNEIVESGDEYWVTLRLPREAIEALEGRGEIWDCFNDSRIDVNDDLENAYDRRAALFWLAFVRGGILVRVGRSSRRRRVGL